MTVPAVRIYASLLTMVAAPKEAKIQSLPADSINQTPIISSRDPSIGGLQSSFRGKSSWILLLEDFLLFLIPVFLIMSLRKNLRPAFFVALAAILVLLCLVARLKRKNIRIWLAIYLFGSSWAAFVLSLWSIYDLGTLRVFGDSVVFLNLSKLSLTDLWFWAFGSRPFLTPLIFKIFHQNLAAVNDFYILIYALAAAALFFAVSLFFQTTRERLLAGYGIVLFFCNQQYMSLWLSCATSELPSQVVVALIIAAFGISYAYRRSFRDRNTPGFIILAGLLMLSVWLAFSRDANAYFLPFMAAFYFAVFRKWGQRTIAAFCLFLVFFGALASAERAGRWRFPLGNVLFKRIIPNDEWRKLFQQEYAFPSDPVVLPCAGLWFQQGCPGKPAVKAWIQERGSRAYRDFLAKHPVYVVAEWIKEWRTQQESLWILERAPKYYAAKRVREKRLNSLVFHFPGYVPLPLAVLICILGAVFFRRNPLILFCVAYSFIVGIVSFHADAQEVSRHTQQAAMALKLAFLLTVLYVYVWLKTRLISRHKKQV